MQGCAEGAPCLESGLLRGAPPRGGATGASRAPEDGERDGAAVEAEATAEGYLARISRAAEPVLEALVREADTPPDLREAMAYSLLSGGKRLRPAVCLAAAEACGAQDAIPRLLVPACALELVHTYSLIHDDLPCMDDAALRRGRPSCHRVYGEALALLAGDALQARAFEALARPVPGVSLGACLAAVGELAAAVGPRGMCGGQALDLAAVHCPPDAPGLRRLQAMKTGALLTAAAVIGGLLAGAPPQRLEALRHYGRDLGVAFQLADDVLDVVGQEAVMGKPAGGDDRGGKPTMASLLGVAEARREAEAAARRAAEAVAPWGESAARLCALAAFAAARSR